MKAVLGVVVVLVIVIAAVLVLSPKAPEDVQQATIGDAPVSGSQDAMQQGEEASVEITSFGFVGYGPGKSHTGTFERFEVSDVTTDAGTITGGKVTFYVDSVKTDTEMLDTHLKEKKEFFDGATYPTITFALSEKAVAGDDGLYRVTGDLTVKNVTKRISFMVTPNEDKSFTSEFRVAMDQFGFSAPGIVDNEVLVQFSGKLN